jgi:hypothetical protein
MAEPPVTDPPQERRIPDDRRERKDRRSSDRRLDERRKAGIGEVIPERRQGPRRTPERRTGNRRD